MRIWDIDPGFLNDKSLLGEHRELHGLMSIHVNGKTGYSRHPETMRWTHALTGLYTRHGILVQEMKLRRFNHKSPLEIKDHNTNESPLVWPEGIIDPPHDQFYLLMKKYQDKPQGRIPLPWNVQKLWASHKYSVMAREPELYRSTGPKVAAGGISFQDLSYLLVNLLRICPLPGRMANTLEHMWGYVSDKSPALRKKLTLNQLFREIQVQAMSHRIDYLLESTALGELGAWLI